MNIAFGTVLTIFFLSPGFALRYSFLKGPYSRKISRPSNSEEIFWSVIPAVIIQLFGLIILNSTGTILASKDLYYILLASDKLTVESSLVTQSLSFFLVYQIALITSSLALGWIFRIASLKNQWDKKFSFLTVSNEWYYLFSGRILENSADIEITQVDVLVKTQEGNIIYTGILNQYFLDSQGSIDKLYLFDVYRRKLNDDKVEQGQQTKEFDQRYYNMPGDYFVVFGREIINLNITYYKLSET